MEKEKVIVAILRSPRAGPNSVRAVAMPAGTTMEVEDSGQARMDALQALKEMAGKDFYVERFVQLETLRRP